MLEIDWNTSTILAEVFYCIIGLIFAFTGSYFSLSSQCFKK